MRTSIGVTMKNKLYAKKRNNEWWSVIDCGETKKGGMTTGLFSMNHFEKDGRTYRYADPIFMPPENLVDWQEIHTLQKFVTVIVEEGKHNVFTGWADREEESSLILQKFAKLLGKDLTIEEIKKLRN